MSFGGIIHYGMKYAHRINMAITSEQTAPPKEAAMAHPCPACCHVDRCKNIECGAHPNHKEARK